jgi:hypothetical protein
MKTAAHMESMLPPLRWRRGSSSGFTLVELVITVGTTLIAVLGSIQLFTYCMWQSENSGNLTSSMQEAFAKVEEIRATPYGDIMTTFGPLAGQASRSFTPTRVRGLGIIYVNEVAPDLLQVEVVVNWQERGRYVVGEDRNLNGLLDGGEDGDGNGRISSPASLVTLVTRR